MPPQEKKAKRICGKAKETEHTHNLENGDAWSKGPVDNLSSHGQGGEKNKPTFEQSHFGLDGSPPRDRVKAETVCQRVSEVIEAVSQQGS
jgi:hypothetical protein